MKRVLTTTMLFLCFIVHNLNAQTTRTAGTYLELTAAILASSEGDIIKFTNNIVITAEVTSVKALTFNGNGYTTAYVNATMMAKAPSAAYNP